MQDDNLVKNNSVDEDSPSLSPERVNEEDKIPEPMVRREHSNISIVLMKAQTWDRESHGLYDYESRRVQKVENKVETEGAMIRGKEQVSFQCEYPEDRDEEDTMLFKLKKESGKFFVSPINDNQPNDRLWLVIRSLKEGYTIKRHDILKLGRMKFKVKEFRTEFEYFEGDHVEKSPHEGFDELHEVSAPDQNDIM